MKLLPSDIEAEQCVLGCCLIDTESITLSIENLEKEDFYREDHKIIFRTIYDLFSRNEPVDVITLKNELESIGKYDEVGGLKYIATLPDKVPTTANVQKYINIIKEKSIKRHLIEFSNELSESSFNPMIDSEQLTEFAEKKVFELTQRKNVKGVSNLKDLIVDSITNLENISANGIKKGISTGFIDIDKRTGGLKGSELIILAARPRNAGNRLLF